MSRLSRQSGRPVLLSVILATALTLVAIMMIEERFAVGSGPSRHVELVVLAIAALLVAERQDRDVLLVVAPVLVLLALLGGAALRHGSSVGPALSTAALLLIVAVTARLGPRRVDRVVLGLLVPLLVLSLAVFLAGVGNTGTSRRLLVGPIALLPDLGRARGVFTWASDLATVGAIVVLVALRAATRRGLRVALTVPLVLLGVVAILVADGLTTVVALALVLAAVAGSALLARRRTGSGSWPAPVPVLSAAVVAVGVLLFPLVVAITGRPGLTGRAVLWRRILDEVTATQLLTGHGHRPLARQDLGRRVDLDWAGHAHHTGLEVVLALGIAGVLVFLTVVVTLLVAAHRAARTEGGWPIGFAVLWIVSGLTEAQLDRLRPSQVLVTAILFLLVLARDGAAPGHGTHGHGVERVPSLA